MGTEAEAAEVVESVSDLAVQDPPGEEFSAADLRWVKYASSEHQRDDVALIPYERMDAFIAGECSNPECPTRFHIERGRKRDRGTLREVRSDDYLLYRMYWCSFGPENYGEGGTILPSRKYRLNTRNRAALPQSMRGCTCHFAIKRLYARPSLVLIIYHERRHINKSGFICHGPLDRDAIGPGARRVPYVGSEIQQQTMSLIYLGVPEENILQTHMQGIHRYCGSDAKVDSLASQYVQKLGMIIKRSTHELDLDDQASIRMWVDRNKKSVFYYQDSTDTDAFVLGIQTEWQLQQMIRFGHQDLLASHSSFGVSKLKYPLHTLLVFDSRQHALPVAWIITRSVTKQDTLRWMKALTERIYSVDSTWRIGGFVIDDPASELDPIRDVFSCPILFSLWHIRRTWLKNIIKKCSNSEVQREMFMQLGKVMYSIWSEKNPMDALEQLFQDFVDQTTFIQYFKSFWVPKLEMWIDTIRSLPLASQESSGTIEAYHLKLKVKAYDDSQLDALQRVDWLVHKLTTELHSSYWLNLYADESGSFPEVKAEYIASTSWQRALQIPDDAVIFDDKEPFSAKVTSQKDTSQMWTVWNAGSEFSLCDCSWSMQGNLCKHIIKVNMMCGPRKDFQPSLSFQSFQRVLLDLWQKPMDDSFSLDLSVAWVMQMQERIQKVTQLATADGIAQVSNRLPIQWTNKKGRKVAAKRTSPLRVLPHSNGTVQKDFTPKKSRKRKRLSTVSG
uniref:SWIM-type domain-containing protein n=1 Tax=Oryza meridionalis TaxID=40149 RepID=A0A0E0EQM9_9ORYZ